VTVKYVVRVCHAESYSDWGNNPVWAPNGCWSGSSDACKGCGAGSVYDVNGTISCSSSTDVIDSVSGNCDAPSDTPWAGNPAPQIRYSPGSNAINLNCSRDAPSNCIWGGFLGAGNMKMVKGATMQCCHDEQR
jgi:hypothetical protein